MRRPVRSFLLFAVVAIPVGVFWRTAYPTITWWDSSVYSLAAHTLGLTSAPGSLLLTLLGWPVSHLPLGMSPARVLNLFAGVLAGIAACLVFVVSLRLGRASTPVNDQPAGATFAGAAIGALTFAFSATVWEHAIKFTPYVLTAVFTGLILWTMLRWWVEADDPGSWRWLLLLGVLFGLDFSVHRTNALLIPGVIAWIAIRRPRPMNPVRIAAASGAGLFAGLAVQLLVIPIARYTTSPINMYEPSNWSRFWSYVSLESSGGNFLINLWPRKSPFWSVQVMDVVRIFGDNFFHWTTSASALGVIPALAAIGGFIILFRRSRRLAAAWTVALFLQVACTVVYFNIPGDFFRPFDRHYLPIFVMVGVTMAVGMSACAEYLFAAARRVRAPVLAGTALMLAPFAQLVGNWKAHDASNRYFAEDVARNALESLPRDAIYFTVGDNDTFPVMYMQGAEGVRADVRIMNVGLSALDWYAKQMEKRDSIPLVSFTASQRMARSRSVRDTLLSIPVAGSSDTVRFRLKPSYGGSFLPNDLVIMDIVSTNRWRRPITFAITTGSLAQWLPNTHVEGVYSRVDAGASSDSTVLGDNLMSRYVYRGYDDMSVRIEPESRTMAFQYLSAFKGLLGKEHARGRDDFCRAALRRYLSAFPPEHLNFGEEFYADLRGSCA
jgi:hypothetical protein